jgi:hypothetical protein
MKFIVLALSISLVALTFDRSKPSAIRTEPKNATPDSVQFGDFDAQIEVEKTEFEVRGGFTLGANSNGINLFKEDVTYAVGPLSKTIPAGSFKEEKRGKISYSEVAEDLIVDVTIRIVGNNKFEIKIEGTSSKVTKDVVPEDITLKIGDDEGRARPRVKTGKVN